MNYTIQNLLKSMDIFNGVSKNAIKELSQICNINHYSKGEYIFRDKDEVKNIYVILSGKVSLYKISESAQKKIIFILGKNNIINDVVLEDYTSSINCQVFEECEIISFDSNKFIEIMSRNFDLTKIVIESLAVKVRRLYRQLKNSTPLKVERRVAAKLWKLAKDYGVSHEEGILVDLNISITYLADMFGAPRETISRALKILQDKGLINYKNKKIIVKNMDNLAAFFKSNLKT